MPTTLPPRLGWFARVWQAVMRWVEKSNSEYEDERDDSDAW